MTTRSTIAADTADWIDVGPLDAVPRRGARKLRTPMGCVGLFRTEDDRVFALADRCPHKGGPLSDGIVHGTSVTCPLHGWIISLETGLAQGADAGATPTVAARVENGRILLDRVVLASEEAA